MIGRTAHTVHNIINKNLIRSLHYILKTYWFCSISFYCFFSRKVFLVLRLSIAIHSNFFRPFDFSSLKHLKFRNYRRLRLWVYNCYYSETATLVCTKPSRMFLVSQVVVHSPLLAKKNSLTVETRYNLLWLCSALRHAKNVKEDQGHSEMWKVVSFLSFRRRCNLL